MNNVFNRLQVLLSSSEKKRKEKKQKTEMSGGMSKEELDYCF